MYWSAAETVVVPAGVVTVMFTVPGLTDSGMVVVIWVGLYVMEPMLATVPKSTIGAAAPSMKLVPWIVTLPEGTCGPEVGETDVTVGGAVGA